MKAKAHRMTRTARTARGRGPAGTRSLLCAALAGLAFGCADPTIEPRPVCDFKAYKRALAERPPSAGPVLIAAVPGTMTELPLNAVNLTSVSITNKILVQATNGTRLPNGQVEVYARMVNCTDFPLQLEGRTHFLTEAQSPAEKVSAWQRVHLPPRTIGHYKATSVESKAVSTYFIELREGT